MKQTLKFALLLSAPVLLAGCGKNFVVTAEELCRDWQHQTVSKHDTLTDKTASQIEANNKSRPNWGCQPGENRAKS
jgi:hypothetical protein